MIFVRREVAALWLGINKRVSQHGAGLAGAAVPFQAFSLIVDPVSVPCRVEQPESSARDRQPSRCRVERFETFAHDRQPLPWTRRVVALARGASSNSFPELTTFSTNCAGAEHPRNSGFDRQPSQCSQRVVGLDRGACSEWSTTL